MSIALQIKNEIILAKIAKPCCKKAFLSGVIRGAGSLTIESKGLGLIIQHPSKELIDKCVTLIRSIARKSPAEMQKDTDRPLGNRLVYELYLNGTDSKALLIETGITSGPLQINDNIPPALIASECCKKSYIKGLFAASGILSIAEEKGAGASRTKGYSLEITLSNESIAKNVLSLLDGFGIEGKLREKKGEYIVYLKDSEKIGDFCAVAGANEGYFALQEIILSRMVRNTVNRQYNCELANIDRALAAAARQLEAIRLIEETDGLRSLDEPLRLTAEARINNPSGSVNDIIAALPDPPTKSGLNHRMRRLIEIAEEIKSRGK